MTQAQREELKRLAGNADKLITLHLAGNIPWNQGAMDSFNVAANPKVLLDLLAENERMRELLTHILEGIRDCEYDAADVARIIKSFLEGR